MSSRLSSCGVLVASLFVLGSAWQICALSAQEPAKDAPAQKPGRVEEEDSTPKAKPAKAPPDTKEAPAPAKDAPAPTKPPDGGKKRSEEEDTAAPVTKKVIHVDEDDAPAKALPGRLTAAGMDLTVQAKQTKNKHAAKLYKKLAIPYDLFNFAGSSGREERVKPIAAFIADNPQAYWKRGGVLIQQLDSDGLPTGRPHNPPAASIRSVKHYEQIAMESVKEFLDERTRDHAGDTMPRDEQLLVAETVLSAAVRFHESSKATGVRKGEEWYEAVEKPLKSQLLEIRLEQLKVLADAGHWDPAFNLAVELAREFREPDDQKRIAKPLIELLRKSLNGHNAAGEKTRQALRRLRELQDQFSDRQVLQPIDAALREQADVLFNQAKEFVAANQPDKALEAISQAVELAPQVTRLRTYQRELMQRHRILRVGVRSLPEFMSPSLATSDSELRTLELLFESLVKCRVDPHGNARYVADLAETYSVVALARRFALPRNAYWSNGNKLTANDIRDTVRWYKADKGGRLTPTWARLLDNVEVRSDSFSVYLGMQQGYVAPLSLMMFKVMPSGSEFDSEEFARHPISSGPYVYDDKVTLEAGRPCVSFVSNPLYGKRHTKGGLPRIQEIRLFQYVNYNPAEANATVEFERPVGLAPLDMLLDLSAEHAAAIKKQGDATRVRIRHPGDGAAPNRRIHFLAINQKIPPFEDDKVRRAMAHAINREKILDDFFRPKVAANVKSILGPLHTALNGPYPADSWACDKKVGPPRISGSLDLFDEGAAKGLFNAGIAGKTLRGNAYQLKYANDDEGARDAMAAICKQLSILPGLRVEPLPVSRRDLRNAVETGSYELAYYSFDFQDETYSLWPLLAPRAARGALNIFQADAGRFESLFQDVRAHRDFEQLQKTTHLIHDELYATMPFVPLWQLDPLIAIQDGVEAPPFDPLLIFDDIEHWSTKGEH